MGVLIMKEHHYLGSILKPLIFGNSQLRLCEPLTAGAARNFSCAHRGAAAKGWHPRRLNKQHELRRLSNGHGGVSWIVTKAYRGYLQDLPSQLIIQAL